MTTVIKLYNPNERPFGALSNNSLHQMRIDGKVWNTVTNYIYTNMLTTPLYRNILQNTPVRGKKKNTNIDDKVNQLIANQEAMQERRLTQSEKAVIYRNVTSELHTASMNIDQIFNMYLGREYFNTVRTAVEKAYNTKFSDSDELVHILLSTGNAPIHYVSNNTILGGGSDGRGHNIVGLILMQIRHNLRQQARKHEREEQDRLQENHIFTAYLAYKILLNDLNQGKDIKQYLGKNAADIVHIFQGENDISYVFNALNTTLDTKPEILMMYRRGKFPEIGTELKNPGTLGLTLRKKMLGKIAKMAESARKNAIFSVYVKYEAKRDHESLDEDQLETAFRQLISQAPSIEAYMQLRDRVVKLYTNGEFSECCSEKIEQALVGIKIPSASDIEDAERSIVSAAEEIEVVEDQGSSSSSSSNGEHDPLKALFQSDERSEKHMLIKKLQYFTGKPYKRYKNYDIAKLQKVLSKYDKGKRTRKGGHYQLLLAPTNIRKDKPTLEKIRRELEEFKREGFTEAFNTTMEAIPLSKVEEDLLKMAQNMDGNIHPILVLQKEWIPGGGKYEMIEERSTHRTPVLKIDKAGNIVFDDMGIPEKTGKFDELEITTQHRKWIPDPAMEPPKEVHFPEQVEDLENVRYIKPHGEPVRLFADPAKNEPQFVRFVPNSQDPINIAEISITTTYPSISMYITVSLLATTGTTTSLKSTQPRMIPKDSNTEKRGYMGQRLFYRDDSRGGTRTITKGMGIQNAINMLRIGAPARFIDIDAANQIYADENNKTFKHLLRVYAKIGIWKKFEDYNLQDLLLMTQNARLLWADPADVFLGAGTKENPGENVVGDLLMEKRDQIKHQRSKMAPVLIQPNTITDFIENDRFMGQWVYMRLGDMCNAVYKVKQYLWETEKLDEEIDAKFVTAVLDTIFQPCDYINMYRDKIETTVPNDFISTVTRCGGMKYKPDKELKERIVQLKKSIEEKKYPEHFPHTRWRTPEGNTQVEIPLVGSRTHGKWPQWWSDEKEHESKEDRQARAHQVKQLEAEMKQLMFIQDKKVLHYETHLKDLAQVYWDRLVVMIYFLINFINSQQNGANPVDIKLMIAKIETLNSKNTVCDRILDDEQDNCIASALLNILLGIEKFKTYYAEDIPLGIPDVNLAASLILNKDVFEEDIVDVQNAEDPEFLEVDGDFDIPGDDSDEENADPYSDRDAEFQFKGKYKHQHLKNVARTNVTQKKKHRRVESDDIEIIKDKLRALDSRNSIEDINSLAKYFMNIITNIKSAPVSNKVKTNRINFFATIR